MRRRYWDADCFLGWLNGEPDKVPTLEPVIRLAEAGQLEIVTSFVTMCEVLFLRRPDVPRPEQAEQIEAFFEQPYIVPVAVDRVLAEQARKVVWEHAVAPRDAIHVATAHEAGVEQLDTFDQDLIDRAPNYPVRVDRPNVPHQQELLRDNEPTDPEQ